MTDSKLIDTSIWLDYFFKCKYKEIIDQSQILLISSLTIFEVQRKIYKEKMSQIEIDTTITFLKQKSLIEPITPEIAQLAATLSFQYNLAAVDALIYATTMYHKAQLITRDNDFQGLPNVTVLT